MKEIKGEINMPHLHLPLDILIDIFIKLPIETLLRCRSLSKCCCQIIDDPIFAYNHLNKSPPHYFPLFSRLSQSKSFTDYCVFFLLERGGKKRFHKKFKIPSNIKMEHPTWRVGSCNGLLCFTDAKEFRIANPLLKQHIKNVPRPAGFKSIRTHQCGFGFDESTKRFKIVCLQILCSDDINHCRFSALVHDLCSSTDASSLAYRQVSSSKDFPRMDVYGKSIFADEALHWNAKLHTGYLVTICFNLKTESIEIIPLPTCIENSGNTDISLFDWEGSLGMIHSIVIMGPNGNFQCVADIWVLTKNNDRKIWVHKAGIQLPKNEIRSHDNNVKACGFVSPSHILLRNRLSTDYYIGDLKTGFVENCTNYRYIMTTRNCCHKGSLISPTRLGELYKYD